MSAKSFLLHFERGVPSLEKVLERLNVSTGMRIEYQEYVEDKSALVKHASFTDELRLELSKDYVVLRSQINNPPHYLGYALMAVLKDMGGNSAIKIPAWSRKKWQDIRWWEMVPK